MTHLEKTLVLIKPDAVERAIVGKIITRLEEAGFKICALKLVKPSSEIALGHYTEEIAQKHGQHMRDYNVNFLTSGPVVAMVIEGVKAVENIRKFCGTTEPKASPPGTIRGDYSHMNYGHADENKSVAKNIIHASDSLESAEREIAIWFDLSELVDYENVHEKHTR